MLDMGNYRGNAVVNYTDYEVPYTELLSISTSVWDTARRLLSQENIRQHGRGEKAVLSVSDPKNDELFDKYERRALERRMYSSADDWACTAIWIWIK